MRSRAAACTPRQISGRLKARGGRDGAGEPRGLIVRLEAASADFGPRLSNSPDTVGATGLEGPHLRGRRSWSHSRFLVLGRADGDDSPLS